MDQAVLLESVQSQEVAVSDLGSPCTNAMGLEVHVTMEGLVPASHAPGHSRFQLPETFLSPSHYGGLIPLPSHVCLFEEN